MVCVDPLGAPDALTELLRAAPRVLCLLGVVPKPDADLSLNLRLVEAVLDAAHRAQAGPVLIASSAAVYGNVPGLLTEEGPVQPLSAYGQAKHAMELMAAAHEHPCCLLRIGNIAGADAILESWHAGMALDYTPEYGTPRRSYIGPYALAKTLATLTDQSELPQRLNVAAPGAVAMGALLDAAGRAWHRRAAGAGVIWDVTLDTERLEKRVYFLASDSTAQGIVDDWRRWKETYDTAQAPL